MSGEADDLDHLDQRQLLVLVVGELRALRRLVGAIFVFAVVSATVVAGLAAVAG